MKIDVARIPERMRASGAALAGGRDVWRDSGAVRTQMEVAQSDYAIEVRDTHFQMRSSAPLGRTASRIAGRAVFGRAWQGYQHGYGVWEVRDAGNLVHRRVGVLDFEWPLQHGHQLWGQFIDRDGNEGGWFTHTAVVDGSIDHHQYVDAVDGDDGNNGLEPERAVATAYQARLNMEGLLGANQVGAIHYARGQVHIYTSTTLPWQGHLAGVRRRCIFDGYGVGADPILRGDGSGSSAFTYGNQDSIELHGLRLEGQRIFDVNSVAVSCLRSPGARSAQNLIVRNCYITDYRTSISIEDAYMTKALRMSGAGDFVCIFRCTLTNAGSLQVFDSLGSRYVSITETTEGKTFGESGANIHRVSNWYQGAFHAVTWDAENVGSLRFQSGRDTNATKDIDEMAQLSFSNCVLKGRQRGGGGSKFGFGRPAPDSAIEGLCRDVRLFGCTILDGDLAVGGGVSGQTNALNVYREIQVWSCSIGGSIEVMGGSASGRLESLEVIDTAIAMTGALVEEAWVGPSQAIILNAAEQERYAEGSVRLRGCTFIWPAESAAFQRVVFYAPWLRLPQMLPAIDSDYCHAAHVGTDPVTWVDVAFRIPPLGTLQVVRTLAQWRGDSGQDANSTTRGSSNLGVIELGTEAGNQFSPLMNLAYSTGAGPVNDLGWPRVHALDRRGRIRFDTPDPGPEEEGATDEPQGPPGFASGIMLSGFGGLAMWSSSSLLSVTTTVVASTAPIQSYANATSVTSVQAAARLPLLAFAAIQQAGGVAGIGSGSREAFSAAGFLRLGAYASLEAAVSVAAAGQLPMQSSASIVTTASIDVRSTLSLVGFALVSDKPAVLVNGVGFVPLFGWATSGPGVIAQLPSPSLRSGPLALRRLREEQRTWPRWKWERW